MKSFMNFDYIIIIVVDSSRNKPIMKIYMKIVITLFIHKIYSLHIR